MVLAARTDTEPVVLDLGTTISSLCEESCLAVGQRDRVRVLLAVLVHRSLFQLCGPGNSLCWSSVLRFCGYLDRVFPVASFPLVHLGEPSCFHETFRWTCPARRETSSNRIRFRPTYIKPSSLNYPRRLVTVSRVLPIKLAITSRSSAEVFRIEETSKGREAASEDAAALRRFTWHGARVGPHQSSILRPNCCILSRDVVRRNQAACRPRRSRRVSRAASSFWSRLAKTSRSLPSHLVCGVT